MKIGREPYAFVNFFATDDGSKITSATLGGGVFESDNLSILEELTSVRGTVIQECPAPTFACSPLRGDFNGDEVVDLLDIDLLVQRFPYRRYVYAYDLNGDQLWNQDDLTEFLGGNIITDGNKLNGDADFDGTGMRATEP